MPKIAHIRPVLLSSPYAKAGKNLEVDLHLRSGYRTTGLVEVTLDNGITGLGEGYLAVFAPKVFVEVVDLIAPYFVGRNIMNSEEILRDLATVINYWSMQGAARHVYSALEIALSDCKARHLCLPVYQMLGAQKNRPLALYGSGGDSPTPQYMLEEFGLLERLGIQKFKIRARNNQTKKAVWCLEEGKQRQIDIAIDMTQNLAVPGQSVQQVIDFHDRVTSQSGCGVVFLEEVLGVYNGDRYPELRSGVGTKIAGGEIVTTPQELAQRIASGWYDIAQPDATVIGGIGAVMDIFKAGQKKDTEVVVHCWGGPVGMMANYHAAMAGGGSLAEWPMPPYPLRDAMVESPWNVRDGQLVLSEKPGLGIRLTKEIEREFCFRPEAIYRCLVDKGTDIPDEVWNR